MQSLRSAALFHLQSQQTCPKKTFFPFDVSPAVVGDKGKRQKKKKVSPKLYSFESSIL